MSPMLERLWQGFLDTLLMIGASSAIVLLVGIPLALVLVTTGPGGIFEARLLNRILGGLVNVLRSVPFLILMVALIPFTRMIVGTSYGVWAAVVPLTIAATPFFARIAEVSLREVDHGLVEAAQAMGCERRHIICNVLLPEARPGIVGGFTITLVTMINSSAMAGAIGAGGLGDLAYRYGYQRFDTQVMLTVIIVLVLLVTLIQFGGDRLARLLNKRLRIRPPGLGGLALCRGRQEPASPRQRIFPRAGQTCICRPPVIRRRQTGRQSREKKEGKAPHAAKILARNIQDPGPPRPDGGARRPGRGAVRQGPQRRRRRPWPAVIAHRGASYDAPEETAAAYLLARDPAPTTWKPTCSAAATACWSPSTTTPWSAPPTSPRSSRSAPRTR